MTAMTDNYLTSGMMTNDEGLASVLHGAELGLPLLQLRHQFLSKKDSLNILPIRKECYKETLEVENWINLRNKIW